MSDASTLPRWVDNSRIGCGAGADFPFDPYLNVSPEKRTALYQRLEGWLDGGRRRRRRPLDREHAECVVGCVVANAIIALARGPRTRVHYSRGKSVYAGRSPYYPDWLSSKLLVQVVDQLAQAGLLLAVNVEPWAVGGWSGHRSTYELTAEFESVLSEIECREAVRDDGAAPVIQLRDASRKLLPYDPSDPTLAELIAGLRAWNSMIDRTDLGLRLPAELVLIPPPNTDSKRLYRLFDGGFDLHGRFYGGWWQNQPKSVRRHLTINSQATAEVDYSGLHPRLLYHQVGRDLRDDPYLVPEILAAGEAAGISRQETRQVVKRVFGFLINVRRRGGYGSAAFDGWPPGISKSDGVAAILRRHEPIQHLFFRSEGLSLMNRDSQICHAVMQAGVADGIAVLPIHDSFIVRAEDESWLRNKMVDAYRAQTGFNPVLS